MSVYNVTYINKKKKDQLVLTEVRIRLPQIDSFYLTLDGVTGAVIEEPELIIIDKIERD